MPENLDDLDGLVLFAIGRTPVTLGGVAAGLLINVTADKVVRFLPPLIFTENEAKELVDRVTPLIKDFLAA